MALLFQIPWFIITVCAWASWAAITLPLEIFAFGWNLFHRVAVVMEKFDLRLCGLVGVGVFVCGAMDKYVPVLESPYFDGIVSGFLFRVFHTMCYRVADYGKITYKWRWKLSMPHRKTTKRPKARHNSVGVIRHGSPYPVHGHVALYQHLPQDLRQFLARSLAAEEQRHAPAPAPTHTPQQEQAQMVCEPSV